MEPIARHEHEHEHEHEPVSIRVDSMTHSKLLPEQEKMSYQTPSHHNIQCAPSTASKAQHEIANFKVTFETDSASPMSRCSSGSSLSTTLSHLSSYSLPSLNPSAQIGDLISNCYHKLHRSPQRTELLTPLKSKKLLLFQIKILFGILIASLSVLPMILLNLGALIFLILTSLSFALLFYTSYRYVCSLHQKNPRFLFHCLPTKMRSCLMETSVHRYMVERKKDNDNDNDNDNNVQDSSSFYMRYMFIYFIPGLNENDLARLIEQLPMHHRQLLLQPGGIAKMLLPESILNFFAPPPRQNNVAVHGHSDQIIMHDDNDDDDDDDQVDAHKEKTSTSSRIDSRTSNHHTSSLSPWDHHATVKNDASETNYVRVESPTRSISMDLSVVEKSKRDRDNKLDEERINNNSPSLISTKSTSKPEESNNSLVMDTFNVMMSNYSYNAAYSFTRWTKNATERYAPYFIFGGLGLSGMASAGALGWCKQAGFSYNSSINGIFSVHGQSQSALVGYGLLSTALYGTSSAFMAWLLRHVSREFLAYNDDNAHRHTLKDLSYSSDS